MDYDFGFDDDYVDDILAQFFVENSGRPVLESETYISDDETYISDVNDVEPTDAELDAIESEIGVASV